MNRVEELTLKLADRLLTDEESRELDGLVTADRAAARDCIALLSLDAELRGELRQIDVATRTMGALQLERTRSLQRSVMGEIRRGTARRAAARRTVLPSGPRYPSRSRPLPILPLGLAAALVLGLGLLAVRFAPRLVAPRSDGLARIERASPGATIRRGRVDLSAAPGAALRAGDTLVTRTGQTLTLSYGGEDTRVALHADTTLRLDDATRGKALFLAAGELAATVATQPADKPMVLTTAHARAVVAGTALQLAAGPDRTRLDVLAGRVQFTHLQRQTAIWVAAGQYAVAAKDMPFVARPLARSGQLDLDFTQATSYGDGSWEALGPSVLRQTKVSRLRGDRAPGPTSNYLAPARSEGSLRMTADVRLLGVTPDRRPGTGAWGFGFTLVFANETIEFRTLQNSAAGSHVSLRAAPGPSPQYLPSDTFQPLDTAVFQHGQDGTFHLKLHVDRQKDGSATMQGKIWAQGPEPVAWMVATQIPALAPLTRAGPQTVRCAAEFSRIEIHTD
ncbi:MAG: FecR domain-containing protein [Kiritimatiellae bacterium]|nr:FecR domain-containing protein [Kiritimatiellia bacterium]